MNATTTISATAQAAREAHRATDGRFGSQPQAESDVDLAGPGSRDWSSTVDDRSVLAACKKFAGIAGSRYGVTDRGELEGEIALHWSRYLANRKEKVRDGLAEPQPDFNVERHIKHIATGLGQREASGLKHGGRDLTALTKWLKTRETFESEYGRPMNRKEEDELADQIRASFPAGKRPVDGFHRAPTANSHLSLDGMREENTSWEPPRRAEDETESPDAQLSDAAAHDALDVVDAGGRGSTQAATRALWGVVSAATGARQVEPETLDPASAREVRDEMEKRGGVEAVLNSWARGEETEEQMDRLLAPWGGAEQVQDATERERIIETLERNPDYVDDVWESALLVAGSRASRQRKEAVA